jgi:hypothetical protein
VGGSTGHPFRGTVYPEGVLETRTCRVVDTWCGSGGRQRAKGGGRESFGAGAGEGIIFGGGGAQAATAGIQVQIGCSIWCGA